MDVFVQNLFEDIEIPEDVPDIEHIFTPPSSWPSRHGSQGDSEYGHMSPQAAGTIRTLPPETHPICRKPIISAGLTANTQKRICIQHKRPYSAVDAPFVPPVACQTVSKETVDPYKKRCEETKTQNPETRCTTGRQKNEELSEKKKTIAERYPLKGPAGATIFSLLNNAVMNGTPDENGAIQISRNSWAIAMDALDNDDMGCDFRQYTDLPEHLAISDCITQKFNIKWIIREAFTHKFGFRVQWLVVFVVSQKVMGLQVMSVLMDKSGQMVGYMQEEVHTKLKYIVPGSTCILKNVFVYNPVGYMPYLVIKGEDIIKIFRNNN